MAPIIPASAPTHRPLLVSTNKSMKSKSTDLGRRLLTLLSRKKKLFSEASINTRVMLSRSRRFLHISILPRQVSLRFAHLALPTSFHAGLAENYSISTYCSLIFLDVQTQALPGGLDLCTTHRNGLCESHVGRASSAVAELPRRQ